MPTNPPTTPPVHISSWWRMIPKIRTKNLRSENKKHPRKHARNRELTTILSRIFTPVTHLNTTGRLSLLRLYTTTVNNTTTTALDVQSGERQHDGRQFIRVNDPVFGVRERVGNGQRVLGTSQSHKMNCLCFAVLYSLVVRTKTFSILSFCITHTLGLWSICLCSCKVSLQNSDSEDSASDAVGRYIHFGAAMKTFYL